MIIGEFGVAARAAAHAEPDQFRFCGELFRVAGQVGALPLMRFADAITADHGNSTRRELEGLAALYQFIRDCLEPDDWPRFLQLATEQRADLDDLMPIARGVYAVVSGRPTRRPSDSADGPSTSLPPSRRASSSPDTARLWSVPEGRPDLAAARDQMTPASTLSDAERRAVTADVGVLLAG